MSEHEVVPRIYALCPYGQRAFLIERERVKELIQAPMDVLTKFPVRKSKRQKSAFCKSVQEYLQDLGYQTTLEKGSFGCRNLVAGDPEHAKILITAHYDTCARLPFPNLITPCNFFSFIAYQVFLVAVIFLPSIVLGWFVGYLTQSFETGYLAGYFLLLFSVVLMMVGPANPRNANDNTSGVVTVLEFASKLSQQWRGDVCFVLFDYEEAGLIGSASFRSKHKKASQQQLVINLDCVGDGDTIMLFPTGKLRRNKKMLSYVSSCEGCFGAKTVAVRKKGFSVYPSDQSSFPYGVGICALRKSKFGLYLGKIHTAKDIVLEIENVNILCDCLAKIISTVE